jgi:multidrug efflux pump subunit AcrA (membrane-fusion protein)
VKNLALEVGQYVTPGQNLLTIANDAVLEIHVPLDSRDVTHWLPFRAEGSNAKAGAWFSNLDPVECAIRWTEDAENRHWVGKLHQVVKLDQQTRTLTVAVRVDNRQASSADAHQVPLVEGMFCSVKIPGRTLRQVVSVPRSAVSQDNMVYVSVDGRLKAVPVKVARVEADQAYISSGLNPGDLVITTRLVNPLENASLEIVKAAGQG